MKITQLGLILAIKNLGTWLGTWKILQIKTSWETFLWALLIYALINVPSDLYLMNHSGDKGYVKGYNKALEDVFKKEDDEQ